MLVSALRYPSPSTLTKEGSSLLLAEKMMNPNNNNGRRNSNNNNNNNNNSDHQRGSGNTTPIGFPSFLMEDQQQGNRKRAALSDTASTLSPFDGSSTGGMDRPFKRPYHRDGASPPIGAMGEAKLASPTSQQMFALRQSMLGGPFLQPQQQQQQPDFQNSLLTSSLANRQAELAQQQRQLLSRYFGTSQLRLNSLATSLAAPPAMGLGSLAGGHQVSGNNNNAASAAPGSSSHPSLSALLNSIDNKGVPLSIGGAAGGGGSKTPPVLPSAPSSTSLGALSRFQPRPSSSTSLQQAQVSNQNNSLFLSRGAAGSQDNASAAAVMGAAFHRSSLIPSTSSVASSGMPPLGGGMSVGVSAGSGAVDDRNSGSLRPIPLGIDEDPNWLSDFHVFVRKNLVELCWASSEDVALRNASNRVSSHQVGIRCRCCAHLNPSTRAQRSSAFPSSIAQIYQSFTMMLRAHFSSCTEVPPALKERFMTLKSKTTQGATDSKQYWIYSARKLGMVDSEEGIIMTPTTIAAARSLPPFGSSSSAAVGAGDDSNNLPLVAPNDRCMMTSDFLYSLLLQARRVRLQANEQRGNKKSLQLGLPGFACRHCCQLGRMGQCRIFPARRRTLPTKIYDLFEHLQRCTACPNETKEVLQALHDRENYNAKTPGHKEFLDMVWTRLVEQQPQPNQQQGPSVTRAHAA